MTWLRLKQWAWGLTYRYAWRLTRAAGNRVYACHQRLRIKRAAKWIAECWAREEKHNAKNLPPQD